MFFSRALGKGVSGRIYEICSQTQVLLLNVSCDSNSVSEAECKEEKLLLVRENQAAEFGWGSRGRLPRAGRVLMTPCKMAKM